MLYKENVVDLLLSDYIGVRFNTPTIIKFPFEKLVKEHENIKMILLNLNQAFIPASLSDRVVGINADMSKSIRDIAIALQEKA